MSIYAILNSSSFLDAIRYQDFDNYSYQLFKLHPGQVIAIFRIFGIGYHQVNKDSTSIDPYA
jgi:hypothetical protein